MIYLEEKGGLIRNYSVSIVIDLSYSCFHELSGLHSIRTIRHLLSALAVLDLPSFDLIISGDPIPTVICSEVGTFRALNSKSNLWKSLFAMLENPHPHADLASAIHTAFDLRRMRSTEYSHILFVLTDGLYQQSDRPKIIECVNNCVQSGINTIGVGIGIYPKGIEKLFPQVVYSPNPANIMKSIATLFGDNPSDLLDEMPSITIEYDENHSFHQSYLDAITSIIKKKDSPIFRNLKNELHQITPTLEAFDDLYNEEMSITDANGGFINPEEGKNSAIYVKNLLKTQKILIVMLWDHTLDTDESPKLDPKYLFTSSEPGHTECVKTAVDHYGIELVVVQNYEDAINKLLNQEKPGYCDYYATWIICGPDRPVLPDPERKRPDPNLIGQFIDVLIQFWKKGGSLVFWADGDPFYCQLNIFLERVTFDDEDPDLKKNHGKTKLRIGGDHPGETILIPDKSNILSKPGTFNISPLEFKQCQRSQLSHNIGKIYEGETISYAPYNLQDIKPFIPFSRDSGEKQNGVNSGFNSLFYPANLCNGTGDIVIDCGYTKLFSKITTDGTFRYIQNIAGWTARPEVHKRVDEKEPCDWRPSSLSFTIQKGVKWTFKDIGANAVDSIDIVYCIDATGSMSSWIQAARTKAQTISENAQNSYPQISFLFGAILYRDPIDSSSDINAYYQPTNNINNLASWMNNEKATGGGDGPEDWVGAYNIFFNQISWRERAARLIIHIADAPAHGEYWCGSSNHQDQEPLLRPLVDRLVRENIFFYAIDVSQGAKRSFERIQSVYNSQGKNSYYNYTPLSSGSGDSGTILQTITANAIKHISAFKKPKA